MTDPIDNRHDCRKCAHYWPGGAPSYVTGWEGEGPECGARPGLENLKSYPFKNTKCATFISTNPMTDKTQPVDMTIDEERDLAADALRACRQARSRGAKTAEIHVQSLESLASLALERVDSLREEVR